MDLDLALNLNLPWHQHQLMVPTVAMRQLVLVLLTLLDKDILLHLLEQMPSKDSSSMQLTPVAIEQEFGLRVEIMLQS